MIRYLALRLVLAIAVVFLLLSLVFFVSRVLGDPATLMAPLEASPEYVEQLRRDLGFADPIPVQYARFVRSVAQGDLGESPWQHAPALPIVLSRMPATLQLAGGTIAISFFLGVALGIAAARKPGSMVDNLVTGLTIVSASTPGFWLALILILVFAVQLRLFPTSGYGEWQHLVLPLATLVPLSAGRLSQITRSSMIEVLNLDYIRTAYAKGLAERRVVLRHALGNAGLPILTVASDELSHLVGGTVIVETIFGWPGIGRLTIQAIEQRDLPILTSAVLVIGVQLVLLNLLVDILYTRLDPRIRFE